MKVHKPGEVSLNTKRLAGISKKRSFFINDQLHKISSHIVSVCVKRNVGTIVIGKNPYWKTKPKMSKKSNQEFVQIPHSTLVWMIRYKAEREGITVIEQEESYTSKARRLLLIANRSRSNKRRNELMNPYIGLMIYGFMLFRMIRLSNDACMLSVLTVNTMDLHSFF